MRRTAMIILFVVGGIVVGWVVSVIALWAGYIVEAPVLKIAELAGTTALLVIWCQEYRNFPALLVGFFGSLAAILMPSEMRLASVALVVLSGAIGVVVSRLTHLVRFTGNRRWKLFVIHLVGGLFVRGLLNALILVCMTDAFRAPGYAYSEIHRHVEFPLILATLSLAAFTVVPVVAAATRELALEIVERLRRQ